MNQSKTIKELSAMFVEMCGGDINKASSYAKKISCLYGLPGNIRNLMEKVNNKITK